MRVVRIVLLALGIALLVWLTARLGVHQIVAMLMALRWAAVPVVLIFSAHQFVRAVVLTLCVCGPERLSIVDAVRVRIAGEAVDFLSFSGPLAAEPAKAWLLHKRGFDVSVGLAATLAEYLTSSFVAAALVLAGVVYVLTMLHPSGPIRAAAAIVVLVMSSFLVLFVVGIGLRIHIIGAVVRGVLRLWPRGDSVSAHLPALDRAEDLLIGTLRDAPRRLVAIVSLEALAQAFLVVELWWLLSTLRMPAGIGQAALIEGTIKCMNEAFVPGQVGIAEGAYAVVFSVFGLLPAAGLTISLARRIRNALTAAVGLVALFVFAPPPAN